MKLCVVGYLPPPKFVCTMTFLANLQKFWPANKTILYSDFPYWKEPFNLDVIPLHASPEILKKATIAGKPNTWAVNNAVFLTGMRMARQTGFDHAIYVESDCRFGCKDWDQRIFEEHFSLGFPNIASGSLVVWSPFNAGLEVTRRWERLIVERNEKRENPKRNFPIPTYGTRDSGLPSIFPNGALGVYDLRWIAEMFDLNNTIQIASESHAWDFLIGEKIWQRFGVQSFDVVGNLTCIFSGYGDQITTEQERMAMLRNGDVVAVHQVKSDATI